MWPTLAETRRFDRWNPLGFDSSDPLGIDREPDAADFARLWRLALQLGCVGDYQTIATYQAVLARYGDEAVWIEPRPRRNRRAVEALLDRGDRIWIGDGQSTELFRIDDIERNADDIDALLWHLPEALVERGALTAAPPRPSWYTGQGGFIAADPAAPDYYQINWPGRFNGEPFLAADVGREPDETAFARVPIPYRPPALIIARHLVGDDGRVEPQNHPIQNLGASLEGNDSRRVLMQANYLPVPSADHYAVLDGVYHFSPELAGQWVEIQYAIEQEVFGRIVAADVRVTDRPLTHEEEQDQRTRLYAAASAAVGAGVISRNAARAMLDLPPLSPPVEDMIATLDANTAQERLRIMRDVRAAERAREIARAGRWRDARAKARELLLAHCTPEQRRQFESQRRLSARGSRSGLYYVIFESPEDFVRREDGRYFCLQVVGERCPDDDVVLARKLLIEINEPEFLRVAVDQTAAITGRDELTERLRRLAQVSNEVGGAMEMAAGAVERFGDAVNIAPVPGHPNCTCVTEPVRLTATEAGALQEASESAVGRWRRYFQGRSLRRALR